MAKQPKPTWKKVHQVTSKILDAYKQIREQNENDDRTYGVVRKTWNDMLIKMSTGNEYATIIENMLGSLETPAEGVRSGDELIAYSLIVVLMTRGQAALSLTNQSIFNTYYKVLVRLDHISGELAKKE